MAEHLLGAGVLMMVQIRSLHRWPLLPRAMQLAQWFIMSGLRCWAVSGGAE